MNCAVAFTLDLLLHIRRLSKGEDRLLSPAHANMLRKNLECYINGKACPTLCTLKATHLLMTNADLPFKADEKDMIPNNNLAIEYDGELLLLHWCSASKRDEWRRKFHSIRGSRSEVYQYKDGTELRFEFVSLTFDNISYLKVCGFRVYTDYKRVTGLVKIPSEKLDSRLFPYQVEGVRMLETGFRLLADEQGLGKTCQVLQYTNLHPELKHILICCPATLKLNWSKEIEIWTKYTSKDVQILSGGTPYQITTKFAVINYDILPKWQTYLRTMNFDLLIADESHYIQNEKAQRTQAFKKVAVKAKDTIFISGTPFTSRPFQMYTALHSIAPYIFKSSFDYGMRFCGPERDGMHWTFKGATNMDVLHSILMDGICIRRLKEDVLEQLPDKMRIVVPVSTDEAEIRRDTETFNTICNLEDHIRKASNALSTLEWQKQIAYLRKRREISKWVSDFLESGKKLVVFATHKMTLDDLENTFSGLCVRVDGESTLKERDKAITEFQNNPEIKIFLGNMKAAGVGITLTAASDVLFTEFAWTSAEMLQSEDRCHRISQKNSVNVYYMCCPGTIDDRLMDIVNRKAAMHKIIFDGTFEDNMLEIIRKEGGCEYKPLFNKED